MSTATAARPRLSIALGADATGVFDAGLPVLAGEEVEALFGAARPFGHVGPLALFQAGDWLLGAATVPLTGGLEQTARDLYENIFRASHGRHLARIWNYVPAINEPGPGGLENYRLFCRGRSLAFAQQDGVNCNAAMPAASAVGCAAPNLTVAFAALSALPRHVENPKQVPAYLYPPEYGPRPPSFSRASIAPHTDRATVFISGTASIRGHATVAPDNTAAQLDCTLENLREISNACGLGLALDQGAGSTRHFKIYLRHAADQPAVAAVLNDRLLTGADFVSYLQADICRASLLVEIEATLIGVTGIR